MLPLDRKRVLDVGCGSGPQLAFLLEFGARRENLVGIDLLPERVSLARKNLPEVPLICADASGLPLADASFDLLLAFTMFSSVPTAATASAIAAEMRRVLRPGGALVCYDLRVDNPWNPNVHRVSPAQLQMWFPEFAVQATSLTVLPPLARCLGRLAPAVYPVLSSVPFLRTHYLTRIQKPAARR